jgi:hypothetical protein
LQGLDWLQVQLAMASQGLLTRYPQAFSYVMVQQLSGFIQARCDLATESVFRFDP